MLVSPHIKSPKLSLRFWELEGVHWWYKRSERWKNKKLKIFFHIKYYRKNLKGREKIKEKEKYIHDKWPCSFKHIFFIRSPLHQNAFLLYLCYILCCLILENTTIYLHLLVLFIIFYNKRINKLFMSILAMIKQRWPSLPGSLLIFGFILITPKIEFADLRNLHAPQVN